LRIYNTYFSDAMGGKPYLDGGGKHLLLAEETGK
jgi:hypothetical protein